MRGAYGLLCRSVRCSLTALPPDSRRPSIPIPNSSYHLSHSFFAIVVSRHSLSGSSRESRALLSSRGFGVMEVSMWLSFCIICGTIHWTTSSQDLRDLLSMARKYWQQRSAASLHEKRLDNAMCQLRERNFVLACCLLRHGNFASMITLPFLQAYDPQSRAMFLFIPVLLHRRLHDELPCGEGNCRLVDVRPAQAHLVLLCLAVCEHLVQEGCVIFLLSDTVYGIICKPEQFPKAYI